MSEISGVDNLKPPVPERDLLIRTAVPHDVANYFADAIPRNLHSRKFASEVAGTTYVEPDEKIPKLGEKFKASLEVNSRKRFFKYKPVPVLLSYSELDTYGRYQLGEIIEAATALLPPSSQRVSGDAKIDYLVSELLDKSSQLGVSMDGILTRDSALFSSQFLQLYAAFVKSGGQDNPALMNPLRTLAKKHNPDSVH